MCLRYGDQLVGYDHCQGEERTTTTSTDGLSKLRETRGDLLCARFSALEAQVSLSGARAERARELTEKIADALAHAERLLFFVEGDAC